MRLAILGFSKKGNQLCRELKDCFQNKGIPCRGYILSKYGTESMVNHGLTSVEDVSLWTGQQFLESDAIIFVGAVGIAVRMIAPYIKSKTTDPAVVVVDELKSYAIPILSGHIGGANELARSIGDYMGALPIITTATDLNHKFAVDLYAKKHNMWISDLKLAKEITVDILADILVGFESDFTWYDTCQYGTKPGLNFHRNIHISANIKQKECKYTLYLVPRITMLGIGCRKGCSGQVIEEQVRKVLEEANISIHSVFGIATIDIKAKEPGLIELSEYLKVPIYSYTAKQLQAVPGTYTESRFVEQITGTDNVCERAAMAACMNHGGQLVIKKTPGNGVTVAAAMISGEAYT